MEASQGSDAWAAGAGLGAGGRRECWGRGGGGEELAWGSSSKPPERLHQWNLTELALPLQLLNEPSKKACSALRVGSSGTQAHAL